MATTKQICVLDVREAQPGIITIRFVFWIPVTTGYPNAGASSAYPAINTDPNTSGVLALIQAGTLLEEIFTFTIATSTAVANWATVVEPIILAAYQARKNYRAGSVTALPDPGVKYGTLYDSVSGWSA